MCSAKGDVRFTPESGHFSGTLVAKSLMIPWKDFRVPPSCKLLIRLRWRSPLGTAIRSITYKAHGLCRVHRCNNFATAQNQKPDCRHRTAPSGSRPTPQAGQAGALRARKKCVGNSKICFTRCLCGDHLRDVLSVASRDLAGGTYRC